MVAADTTEIEAREDGEGDDGDGGEAKYARRPRSVRRSLQRAFPALFPASLPVTNRRARSFPLHDMALPTRGLAMEAKNYLR